MLLVIPKPFEMLTKPGAKRVPTIMVKLAIHNNVKLPAALSEFIVSPINVKIKLF